MYDLIIIGMGISGISAAIYAKRGGLNVLMLDKGPIGGTLNNIAEVENYPGFSKISGPDLAMNLYEMLKTNQIAYKLEEVTDVILDETKTIKTKNNVYHSRYLLIATGRTPKLLGLKNETEFLGKGISTCALCDGAFYKNKDVAVVGGGNSALQEALYLAKICNTVYLIHRREEFRGEESLAAEVKETKNIKLILNNEIKSLIIEKDTLVGLKLKDQDLNINGLFIYIGSEPNTKFLKNTNLKMTNGYLVVDHQYETNIKGVYSSGDVILKDVYQLITAANDGVMATININKN